MPCQRAFTHVHQGDSFLFIAPWRASLQSSWYMVWVITSEQQNYFLLNLVNLPSWFLEDFNFLTNLTTQYRGNSCTLMFSKQNLNYSGGLTCTKSIQIFCCIMNKYCKISLMPNLILRISWWTLRTTSIPCNPTQQPLYQWSVFSYFVSFNFHIPPASVCPL